MSTTDNKFTLAIGVGYKARNGKDSFCRVIVDTFGGQYDIRKYALADALKEEVDAMDPFEACVRYGIQYDPNPDMSDPMCKTKHGKQSKLLQFWGEYRRKEDQFYWVNKLAAKLAADRPQVALISDVRYKNEFYFVKALGGILVKVERLGFTDLSRDPSHISETELDGMVFDFHVKVPDGNIEELQHDAVCIFQDIQRAFEPHIDDLSEVAANIKVAA